MDTGNKTILQQGLLLEVGATEQMAYQYPSGDLRRIDGIAIFLKALEKTSQYEWSVSVMRSLAEKARLVGDDDLTSSFYKKLAVADSDNATQWYEKLAATAFANENYDEAALAYFAASNMEKTLDNKRHYFINALKVLESGNRAVSACEEGEQRLGELVKDHETLVYMLKLARQVNRHDLVSRYARELVNLLQVSQISKGSAYPKLTWFTEKARQAGDLAQDLITYSDQTHRNAYYSDYSGAVGYVNFRPVGLAGMVQRVATNTTNTDDKVANVAAVENSDFDLAFQAFLEGKQLDEAEKLAKEALDRQFNPMVWTQRLAQVATWNNHPETALKYWLQYARLSGDDEAWAKVLELAPQLDNDQAFLAALIHAADRSPSNPSYVAKIASVKYKQGHLSDAIKTLREARNQIDDSPESAPYWRLYAELARHAQSNEDANFAHQHLLATGQSNDSDLYSITDFYQAYPIDAARMAELQFQQNDSQEAFRSALQYYVEARAWPRIRTLLNAMTPDQRTLFERSGRSLAVRAQYHLHMHNGADALADLRAAVGAPDVYDDIKVLYLWALVGYGTDGELNAALQKWRSTAKIKPSYWGAFAAGELRLGNAARAVVYLRQQRYQSAEDPLWLMVLASAEERAGNSDFAWGVRRQAWRLLQIKTASGQLDQTIPADGNVTANNTKASLDRTERVDLRVARVALSQIFTNGDISRSLLIDLLKQDSRNSEEYVVANSLLGDRAGLLKLDEVIGHESQSPYTRRDVISAATKEVALAWAISGEHYDLARAWLAREYLDDLLRPVNAEITLALIDKDKETLERLLDNRQRPISTGSRIAALMQTGRTSEAETVAYAAAEGAPDNSDTHQVMVDTLLRDRPGVGVSVMNATSDTLPYVESTLVGGFKLTSRLGLTVEAIQRNQRTDTDQLAWVPAHDRELNITLRDTTIDHDLSLTLGHRKAVKSFYTAKVRGKFNLIGPLTTSFTLGVNQLTDLTSHMRVGATKDTAQIGLAWTPESRWFALVTAEADRFHAQGRTYLGHGYQFTQELGYRIRNSYPDWNVRLIGAQGVFSRSNNTISSMEALLPLGVAPLASEFMPQNYNQFGAMVGFGTADANIYSRGWRPFISVGYVHDSNAGWGPRVNLGIGGSVLGGDYLRIFFLHESAGKGSGQRVNQIGLSYRMVF
ncbi:MAG: tetratricopeptide repeat protein [Burkholderiaceae bacterium]|nr:tetratricopeptide repeat protein [Burkholderiaceae bacterium]